MTYTLDFTEEIDLQIIPATKEQAIMQELYCLISTTMAEVPLYRTFGVDKTYMSMPIDSARAMLASTIAAAIMDFMPELTISKIDFAVDANEPYKLIPNIEVISNE